MLYTKLARCWQNILARHHLHSGAILTQCRHYVICRNDAVMRPVYMKQYLLSTGKTALTQYRPITLPYRPDAGPMLYAELARCWQSILAWHWPGTVCIPARHWSNAGITLYAVTTPVLARYMISVLAQCRPDAGNCCRYRINNVLCTWWRFKAVL